MVEGGPACVGGCGRLWWGGSGGAGGGRAVGKDWGGGTRSIPPSMSSSTVTSVLRETTDRPAGEGRRSQPGESAEPPTLLLLLTLLTLMLALLQLLLLLLPLVPGSPEMWAEWPPPRVSLSIRPSSFTTGLV